MYVSVQLHAQTALSLGKGPGCPLNRRRGGPQSQSGRFEEEVNVLPLPEVKPQIVTHFIESQTEMRRNLYDIMFALAVNTNYKCHKKNNDISCSKHVTSICYWLTARFYFSCFLCRKCCHKFFCNQRTCNFCCQHTPRSPVTSRHSLSALRARILLVHFDVWIVA